MAKIANKVTDQTGVVFMFADGKDLACAIGDLPKEMIHQLAIHGLSQKVGDSYSGAESIEDARRMASDVWENLKAGAWAVRVSKGGKVVEAMARALGKPFEDCFKVWSEMDEEAQKELKKHPMIKKAIAEIDLEKANAAAKLAGKGKEGDEGLMGLFS